jgi:hypothetical protein
MAVSGWQTLGDYTFVAGPDQWLRLEDGSGEPGSTMTQEVLDAVRLTRLDLPDAGPGADAGPSADAGVFTGDAIAGGDGGPRGSIENGCSCRAAARSPLPTGFPAVLALLVSMWLRRAQGAMRRAASAAGAPP